MSHRSEQSLSCRRRIFVNRTLNLRAIAAIGFDMDYTLVHYRSDLWEERAYQSAKERLIAEEWPIADLEFDPELFTLGLVIDTELGNIVKANRFGFVKKAAHGTRMLDFEQQREAYARLVVDLEEPRWRFINTLFSLSEACLFAQLVDRFDEGKLGFVVGYGDLYRRVRASLDEAHAEGQLKQEIGSDPDRFVELDEELPLALLDLKQAGKKLIVITNSEWQYTQAMLAYALDPHLPRDMTWRELFDLTIVEAKKPHFFTGENPIFEVTGEDGLLRPVKTAIKLGRAYLGGHARVVERCLGLRGEDILYVGDHIFADVRVTKEMLRWRTALVVRELEQELAELSAFAGRQAKLDELMAQKEERERVYCGIRLSLQRLEAGYGPRPRQSPSRLKRQLSELRAELDSLDDRIAPLARAAGELSNARWGPLMRAGNDKSHLARQIERSADVYTSRVSNFLHATPYSYMRSSRGSLPHDPGSPGRR